MKSELDHENKQPTSSKEMKTAESIETATFSTSEHGMGFFNNMCQEMFEEIGTYLSPNDILNLCLTSKSMNEFIGNNKELEKYHA